MLKFLTVIKNAATFLKTGTAPTNAPLSLKSEMEKVNHLASKKFYIVATSFISLCFFYFVSVLILFFIPHNNEIVSGFVTIFTKTIEVLAIIIASYLGVQAAVDFKYASANLPKIDTENKNLIEKVPKETDIQVDTEKYQQTFAKDNSYAPINWSMSYEKE